ncbi:NineTeen Complex (NTC) component [Pichia californica]|uniref:Pre-mRNA-splicing factor ISY1 n=1 Tax=Pichia californica TaxID=460514 RepID=A0A9P7BDS1_9ASCO|nr:NineTeen Complex (NTC) component [[Candida] californica]
MAPQHDNTTTSTRKGKSNIGQSSKRPRKTDYCNDVNTAIKYRAQILREITNNLARVHDLMLTEYQIRDINDSINKLLKERRSWEYRIKQLGGADFTNINNNNISKDSLTIKGYKYFGRARELPDVVKLLKEANLERESKKEAHNSAKSLKEFENQSNWTNSYYFRENNATKLLNELKLNKFPKPIDSKTFSSINIDFTMDNLITENTEFMEKYLVQKKKKFLLQRIKSKSND